MISHKSSADMAYQLVGYIDCDHRIKDIIAGEFRQPISIGTISKIRKERERGNVTAMHMTDWRDKGADPYFSQEYTHRIDAMERANYKFVKALKCATLVEVSKSA